MTTNGSVLLAERPAHLGAPTMKALVYLGDGKKAFQDKPKPAISVPTDAISFQKTITLTNTLSRFPFPLFQLSRPRPFVFAAPY